MVLKEDIYILGLHGKQEGALRKAGINTIEDLIAYSKDDLLKIKDINVKTVGIICTQLTSYNLRLSYLGKGIKYPYNTFQGKIYNKILFLLKNAGFSEQYDAFLQKCHNLELKAVSPLNEAETCYFRTKENIINSDDKRTIKQISEELNFLRESEITNVISIKLAYYFLPKKDIAIAYSEGPEHLTTGDKNNLGLHFNFKNNEKQKEFPNLKSFTTLTANEFFSLFHVRLQRDMEFVFQSYQMIKNQGCYFTDEEELIRIDCYSPEKRAEDHIRAASIPISNCNLSDIIKRELLRMGYHSFGDLLRKETWRNKLSCFKLWDIYKEIHDYDLCLSEETKVKIVEKAKLEAISVFDQHYFMYRLSKCLSWSEIFNVKQVTSLTIAELSELKYMREDDLAFLVNFIHSIGLCFKEEQEIQAKQKEKEELLKKCQEISFLIEEEKMKIAKLNIQLGAKLSKLESVTTVEEFQEIKKTFDRGENK